MFQHEQAIPVSKVLTYMSFSSHRDVNQLLLHERYKYRVSSLMDCSMTKELFCSLVHCSANGHTYVNVSILPLPVLMFKDFGIPNFSFHYLLKFFLFFLL